jgi:hypothetical protein
MTLSTTGIFIGKDLGVYFDIKDLLQAEIFRDKSQKS